jgi:hypothetical protein
MALRSSTGLRQAIAGSYGWRQALANGRLRIYSGTQPATADTAASGTLLETFTLSGGAFTAETRAQASLTLTGSSGSLDTLEVGGAIEILGAAVSFSSDLTTTAALIAAQINSYRSTPDFTAESSGAVVTIYAPWGLGAGANDLTIASTETTLGVSVNGGSSSTFGGTGSPAAGVTAVNGLNWQVPAAGVLSKETTVWQAVAVASGTAGYFRFEADADDDQGASTSYRRLDGSISTSGADLNISSLSITTDATDTINTFTLTVPAG